jgi:hypothetical protein
MTSLRLAARMCVRGGCLSGSNMPKVVPVSQINVAMLRLGIVAEDIAGCGCVMIEEVSECGGVMVFTAIFTSEPLWIRCMGGHPQDSSAFIQACGAPMALAFIHLQ